mmetsp:Transcript_294/g.546  ORF Transcript_294/g.546 Transcript_294/m.546 type:complete len:244 (-) Transcript_294:1263-1994(-)
MIPITASKTCLLVVDVQPEYWTSCDPVRADFPEFPERCGRAIEVARSRGCMIVWVRADYRREHSPWLTQFQCLNAKKQVDTPCDTQNLEWEPFATPREGEVLVPKASWCATLGARGAGLVPHLQTHGIDTVLVMGLITSVCVQHSAFGLFEAGFRTALVTDACADRGRSRHDAAVSLYGDYMYEILTVDMLESKAVLVAGPKLPLGPPTKKPQVLSGKDPYLPPSTLFVGIAAFLAGYLFAKK